MSRYIRDDEAWHHITLAMPLSERKKLLEAFQKIPTADVRENIHGKWFPHPYGEKGWKVCSNCLMMTYTGMYNYDFCPNCGARMDGAERR